MNTSGDPTGVHVICPVRSCDTYVIWSTVSDRPLHVGDAVTTSLALSSITGMSSGKADSWIACAAGTGTSALPAVGGSHPAWFAYDDPYPIVFADGRHLKPCDRALLPLLAADLLEGSAAMAPA